MLLDDLLEHLRCAGVIPDAFGIHHGDRAARADLEAIRLGAINQRFRPGEIQLHQAPFQIVPRRDALFLRAAPGLRLVSAQKDMPLEARQAKRGSGLLEFGSHGGRRIQRLFFDVIQLCLRPQEQSSARDGPRGHEAVGQRGPGHDI